MPLFAVICRDAPDMLQTRIATREQHLAFLSEAGTVQLAGPFIQDGQPCGSLLIVEGDSVESVRNWAEYDPYAQAGVFGSVEIAEWRKAIG